jgi:4-amino-4-deoxychorismate lyase
MSRLIETIRISGGEIQNLDYHIRRMQALRLKWDVNRAFSLPLPPQGTFKYRIVYDADRFDTTVEPYTIRPIRTLKLVTDNNIVYDHKFEDRRELMKLFAQRGDCDDVLIVKNGVITDTSYSNIIFLKGDQWFTPDTYLLNGTMRQYLLDTGAITQLPILRSNIKQFSHFKLINAMLRDEAPESEVSNIR